MSHDFYLWMAYGVTAAAVAIEIAALQWRASQARRLVEEERDLEAQE